jgi:hypothetical protein
MELFLIVIYVLQWCWEYVQVWTMGFGKSCSTIRDPDKHGPNCLKRGKFFPVVLVDIYPSRQWWCV